MTFDNDFLLLQLSTGPTRFRCKDLGIAWPPPAYIDVANGRFRRLRMSELTDDERAGAPFMCRGAEYVRTEEKEPS